jgi:hypothetical protein
MKLSFFALATGLAISVPLPSLAGTILPNLYAKTFCDLKAIGIDDDGARRTAISQSMISSDDWTMVRRADGTMVQSDIVLAVNATFQRCPQCIK